MMLFIFLAVLTRAAGVAISLRGGKSSLRHNAHGAAVELLRKASGSAKVSAEKVQMADIMMRQGLGENTPQHGCGYLGTGYDILRGNPAGDEGSMLDPGYRRPVIRLTWSQESKFNSRDLRKLQPREGWGIPIDSCQRASTVTAVKTMKDYSASLSMNIESTTSGSMEAGDPIGVASVKASASYSMSYGLSAFRNDVVSKESEQYELNSYCKEYKMGLNLPALNLTITDYFADRVSHLPVLDIADTGECAKYRCTQMYLPRENKYLVADSQGNVKLNKKCTGKWFFKGSKRIKQQVESHTTGALYWVTKSHKGKWTQPLPNKVLTRVDSATGPTLALQKKWSGGKEKKKKEKQQWQYHVETQTLGLNDLSSWGQRDSLSVDEFQEKAEATPPPATPRFVPGFTGEKGPDLSSQGFSQCAGTKKVSTSRADFFKQCTTNSSSSSALFKFACSPSDKQTVKDTFVSKDFPLNAKAIKDLGGTETMCEWKGLAISQLGLEADDKKIAVCSVPNVFPTAGMVMRYGTYWHCKNTYWTQKKKGRMWAYLKEQPVSAQKKKEPVKIVRTKMQQDWAQFFLTFGTHFLSEIELGGRMKTIVIMTKDSSKSITEAGVSTSHAVELALGVKSKVKSGSISHQTSVASQAETKALNQLEQEETETKTFVLGGNPPEELRDESGFSDWADTVDEAPMPVKSKLELISKTWPFLCDIHTIYELKKGATEKTKKTFNDAQKSRCKHLRHSFAVMFDKYQDNALVMNKQNIDAAWREKQRRLKEVKDKKLMLLQDFPIPDRFTQGVYSVQHSSGNHIQSKSGVYDVYMQGDGNLVLYNQGGDALWASNTAGCQTSSHMEVDYASNIRVFCGGEVKWEAETDECKVKSNHATELVIQNDGDLVLQRKKGGEILKLWHTQTAGNVNGDEQGETMKDCDN